VYLAEPATIGDNDLICDIAFPLGQLENTEARIGSQWVPNVSRTTGRTLSL